VYKKIIETFLYLAAQYGQFCIISMLLSHKKTLANANNQNAVCPARSYAQIRN